MILDRQCKPDVDKPEFLKSCKINVCEGLIFTDRILPSTQGPFLEHERFSKNYFLGLFHRVSAFGVHNYKGARIPLEHNGINVGLLRSYLYEFNYSHLHLLQFVEFGFPLGLWSDASLQPCLKNHSSAYSYYSYIDKFIVNELENVGLTGPFDSAPLDSLMLSPLMTALKKPNSRSAVFDASFGLYSLNKNTPEKTYHDCDYEFQFPKIDDLADRIAMLGPHCLLWKRDLSRYYLQLKIDPFEYDKMGFVWRSKVFLFVSFVWGCRHAGYVGQWLTSAVAHILSSLGYKLTGNEFFALNYADDFAGAEASIEQANLAFETLGKLLSDLNLVESVSKASPPSTVMTYLGVAFNTAEMKMYVDSSKLAELKSEIAKWSKKTVAKKYELQSILGKLLWVSRTVRFSRVFVSRIIGETRKLQKQSDKTMLSADLRKDFLWWEKYLEVFSGVEIIPPLTVNMFVYGDACVQGGGSFNPLQKEYFSQRFAPYMCSPETPIHIKEFIIVILSVRLWGPIWSGHRVAIYCDNDAVCDTCTYQKPKDEKLQMLLREFLFWVCKFNIFPILEKISSKDNHIADYISRVFIEADTNDYLTMNGYQNCKKLVIPESWFSFSADW